jgi:purine nucleosidase
MPRKIIIDTDPGKDDAVAILTALGSPEELDVQGIVTVAGNVPLAQTTYNARQILELAQRADIPLYAGCARPMRRKPVTAEHVHGSTGLAGLSLPAPTMKVREQHGVLFIVDALRAAKPGEITLVTLGPLTNIAMAMVLAPDIVERIAEIVMMFGAYSEGGNITPAAEFNSHVDPEAADVVLSSGVKITIVPLDVTHQCLSTRPRLQAFRDIGNACGVATYEMLSFLESFDIRKYGRDGAPLHDPCVIAHLLAPALFGGRQVNVCVATGDGPTAGMSIVDWWGVTERPVNVLFLREVNVPGFYQLLTERLARLP